MYGRPDGHMALCTDVLMAIWPWVHETGRPYGPGYMRQDGHMALGTAVYGHMDLGTAVYGPGTAIYSPGTAEYGPGGVVPGYPVYRVPEA